MIPSLIWSCVFLTFVFHGCLAPRSNTEKMYPATANPLTNYWRRRLMAASYKEDLCGKGIWAFMEEKDKKQAKKDCEEAYNAFVGLTFEEQIVCRNAAKPDCRAEPDCEGWFYTCTFLCDDDELRIRQVNPNTRIYEEVAVQTEKQLKIIFHEMFQTVVASGGAIQR